MLLNYKKIIKNKYKNFRFSFEKEKRKWKWKWKFSLVALKTEATFVCWLSAIISLKCKQSFVYTFLTQTTTKIKLIIICKKSRRVKIKWNKGQRPAVDEQHALQSNAPAAWTTTTLRSLATQQQPKQKQPTSLLLCLLLASVESRVVCTFVLITLCFRR